MFEVIWNIFWIIMAFIALAVHWPVWLAIIFFALAGVIYIDLDDLC